MEDTGLKPLFSNADLEKLALGIKGLTKDERLSVYERLEAIRDYYEKNRLINARDMTVGATL